MAYDTDFTNANDEGLQKRVRVSMCNAALSIVGEALSGAGLTVKHEKRHALGVAVLADGGLAQLERFMFAAVAGGAITPSSTDAQIDTRIAGIWDDLAGVLVSDA